MPDRWDTARDAAGRYQKNRNAGATPEGKALAKRARKNKDREDKIRDKRKGKK